jgi:uncharacterized membrane protein YkoI
MTKTISISLVSLLLLSSVPVVAGAQSKSAARPEREIKSEQTTTKQIRVFLQTKLSLLDAIAATKNQRDGQVMDVTFGVSHGKPVYMVKTYRNREVWEGMVDGQSGKVVDQGTVTPEDQLDDEDKAELAGLQQAKVGLADAAVTAEKSVGGKAINAGLEETNRKVVYEITVVQRTGSSKKVTVDPKTGQING